MLFIILVFNIQQYPPNIPPHPSIIQVNIANVVRGAQSLFPQSMEQLTHMYRNGYHDAMQYLMRNGFWERAEGTAVWMKWRKYNITLH